MLAMSSGTPDPADRDLLGGHLLERLEVEPIRAAVAAVMSVAMKPGAIALTVTPNGPSSIARVLVKPCRPALAAE